MNSEQQVNLGRGLNEQGLDEKQGLDKNQALGVGQELSEEQKAKAKRNTRFLGLFFTVCGLIGMIINWHSALTDGSYYIQASFLAPFGICMGLAVILFPTQLQKSPDGKGLKKQSWQERPLGQRVLIGVGVVLGVVNWLFISGTLNLPGL
jgi:hypothetical protein